MNEASILQSLFDGIDAVLAVFSTFFAIVSVYATGFYFFLARAPLLLKSVAFSMLSIGLVFLGGTVNGHSEAAGRSVCRLGVPGAANLAFARLAQSDSGSARGRLYATGDWRGDRLDGCRGRLSGTVLSDFLVSLAGRGTARQASRMMGAQ